MLTSKAPPVCSEICRHRFSQPAIAAETCIGPFPAVALIFATSALSNRQESSCCSRSFSFCKTTSVTFSSVFPFVAVGEFPVTYPAWLFDADVADYTYLVSNTPVGRMEHSPNFILKNAQSYLLWDMLADDRLVRMYENEALNGADAFKASEMMDMLHRSIFKKTIAGTAPDVRERSMQKNFVDALITAANDKEGVKINSKKLTTDADPSGLLVADPTEFGCLGHICGHNANGLAERLAAGERTAGRRIINFYSGQGNRISDAISLKRGELMRVRDLLKSRIPSAQQDAKYHYQDMLMRINTALGIAQ